MYKHLRNLRLQTVLVTCSFSLINLKQHNAFIDNAEGMSSQFLDDGENNKLYEEMLKEGNFWSD